MCIPKISHLLPLCLLLLAPQVGYGEGVLFRWKLPQGRKFIAETNLEITQGPEGTSNPSTQKLLMRQVWEVKEIKPDGRVELTTTLESAKFDMNIPGIGIVEMDTDKPAEQETGFAAQLGKMFRPMIETPCEYEMSPNGKVTRVAIPESVLKGFQDIPLGRFMKSILTESIVKDYPVFPDEAIGPQHAWERKNTIETPEGTFEETSKFTYAGTAEFNGRTLHRFTRSLTKGAAQGENPLKAKVSITSQKTEGTLLFDNELGYIASSELEQQRKMSIEIAGQPKNETFLIQTMKTSFQPLTP